MNSGLYKNIIWYGLAAATVFAPVVLGANRLWTVTVIEFAALSLIFIWFWHMNNKTGWNFKRTALDLPILGFALLAVVSTIFGIYLHAGLISLAWLFAVIAIYYIVINNFGIRSVERFMFLIVFVGTALSFFGLGQLFLGWPSSWWAGDGFMASTYVNHNHFAGYLEMAIPLALGLFCAQKTLLRRLGLAFCTAIMVTAFVLAQSRGGWVSLTIATLFVTYYLSRKKAIRRYVFFVIALLVVLVFTVLYSGEDSVSARLGSMTNAKGDASFMTRVKIWQGTIDMIKHNPVIGTGIGTLEWGFPHYRPEGLYFRADYAHNDYLQMAAEMGILVLPIMVWILIIILKKGNELLKQPAYAGITTGLVSIILHGFVDFNFHIPANMMLFALLCSFLMLGESK